MKSSKELWMPDPTISVTYRLQEEVIKERGQF